MASKKLTPQQADIRQHLLYRLAQRTENSGFIDSMPPAGLGQVESMHIAPSKPDRQIVLFRGKAKIVTPEEKERFYKAARDPKNKDRKDYPEIVSL